MLRAFTRDSQAQFSLTLSLALEDLVPLHATCRTWRDWLERPSMLPPAASAADESRCLYASRERIIAASHSTLARTHLLQVMTRSGEEAELLTSPVPLLACLSRFSRLTELDLDLHKHDVVKYPSEIHACFASIASTLKVIRVTLFLEDGGWVAPDDDDEDGDGADSDPEAPGAENDAEADAETDADAEADVEDENEGEGGREDKDDAGGDDADSENHAADAAKWSDNQIVASVLSMTTGHLKQLVTLEIDLGVGFDAGKTAPDFACLQTLPLLTTFSWAQWEFACSTVQAQALAKCVTLTDVDCRQWSAAEESEPESYGSLPALIALVDGLTAADRPRPAPFKRLGIEFTNVNSAVFDQLLRISTLTELAPQEFTADVTPQQWLRLQSLRDLHTLNIAPHSPVDEVLAGVLLCPQLKSLSLEQIVLSADQLHSVCTKLTLLESLSFSRVRLPRSVAALSLAPRLRGLRSWDCTIEQMSAITAEQREKNPWDLLQALPAMAHLEQFTYGAPERPPHPVDPRPAMFKRCPLLTQDAFEEVEM